MLLILMSAIQVLGNPIGAQVAQEQAASAGDKSVGAGLAMGFAGAGAGIGLGTASAAAIGAITEKEEMFGKTIIFVGLIEGIAVFGFVVAFLILFVAA